MEDRKFQNKKRYLWAFIIGTAIFFLVFFVSNGISYIELQRISNIQNNLAYTIFSNKLNYTFLENELCSPSSYEQLTSDFNFQRSIMADIEKRLGRSNNAVIERKKFYTLIELEHLEFVEQLNKKCNQSINTILFFYSNKQEDLKKSDDAGRFLDTVYARNPKNLSVYSFDINLDSDLIHGLLAKYNVTLSPTVIVNENHTIFNPRSVPEIENYFFG